MKMHDKKDNYQATIFANVRKSGFFYHSAEPGQGKRLSDWTTRGVLQ